MMAEPADVVSNLIVILLLMCGPVGYLLYSILFAM